VAVEKHKTTKQRVRRLPPEKIGGGKRRRNRLRRAPPPSGVFIINIYSKNFSITTVKTSTISITIFVIHFIPLIV
jgi:hypothetical protein